MAYWLMATLLLGSAFGADKEIQNWPKVLAPGTALPVGAKIQVQPYAPKLNNEVYQISDATSERPLQVKPAAEFMQVTAIHEAKGLGPGEEADLSTSAKAGDLLVNAAELKNSADCTTPDGVYSGSAKNCTVGIPLTVKPSQPYDPDDFANDMMTSGSGASRAATGLGLDQTVLGQMTQTLESINGGMSGGSVTGTRSGGIFEALCGAFGFGGGNADGSSGGFFGLDTSASPGAPPKCAIDAAIAAREKAARSGQRVSNILIVNDFSKGPPGKMWFYNPQGQKINLGVPNPIPVTSGNGGYGSGKGSHRTPDGAIMTRACSPPRAGNITNGIELVGLEPGNQDIFGRGVLLHGANPSQYTSGCLGIPGRLQMANGFNKVLGGADYFDTLANGPLKSGGTIIYNYTPKEKAEKCR